MTGGPERGPMTDIALPFVLYENTFCRKRTHSTVTDVASPYVASMGAWGY